MRFAYNMPFDAFRYKIFSRRIFIISCLQGLGLLLIIARLFKFQILDYNYFKTRSDRNRIKSTILPPARGLILDIKDKIVASNSEYYRAVLKKTSYKEDIETILKLAAVLGFKENGTRELLREYRRNRQLKEVIIYRYLTRKELINIEFNLPFLKNISVGVGSGRIYSHSLAFSHLVGYITQTSASKIQSEKQFSHPDIRIGAEGVEKIYNDILIGKYGVKYTEVNVGGYQVNELETVLPQPGKNIKISFDSIIQIFAYELCKNYKASVVILDISTGEIKVMLSTPSFDINLLSKKVDNTAWYELLNDPRKPLLNRTVQSAYAPGSIFKPITAIAGLMEGYNRNQGVKCEGKIYMYKKWRNCWRKSGHGVLMLKDAIKHSCNITFYNLGNLIRIETFHKVAKEFSLGERFKKFEFTKQNEGINPNETWKKEALKEHWYTGDNLNLAIGQGYVRCNALQIAVMMARIASEGKKIEPSINPFSPSDFENINIPPSYISFVKEALFEASNSPGGTSYKSRIQESGMEFSGKTGTAQVVSKFLEKYEYTAHNRPHGLFAGFAPFHNSKFATAVIIENGGFGSAVAAPIGRNLLYFSQLLDKNRIEDAKNFALNLGIKLPL